MSIRKNSILLLMRIGSDLFMVSLAWVIAYYLRFYTFFDSPLGIPSQNLYFKLIPFIAGIWVLVFAAEGFYLRTGKHHSPFTEALDIMGSCFFATIAFIAFSYFYEEYRYSRLTLLIFAVLHPWMIVAGRSLIRKALRLYRKKTPHRNVLVIGSGKIMEQAIKLALKGDIVESKITAAILVGDEQQIKESADIGRLNRINIIDLPSDWPKFFAGQHFHSVVLALPYRSYQFIENHLEHIANQIADVKIVPDLLRYTKFAAGIDLFQGVPVLSIHESPLNGLGSIAKRLLDIGGATVGILITLPLMLIVAGLVRLTSKGPVFYKQERMGMDGRTFHIIKFRSMPIDAEQKTGAIWATKNDVRPTKLGKVLRKTNLDELPQLINVLKGEMSLVGPRPERPVFVHQFRSQVPGYMLRHKVKAGLTGWAQVNGWRGDTSLQKRIECDLFYIQNWSLWLDLKILGLTLVKAPFNRNAY